MRLPIEASLCGLPRRKRKLLLNDSRPSSKERMSSSALLLERASHPRLASDSDGYLIEVGRYTQKALDRFKNDAGQPETTFSSISLLTEVQCPPCPSVVFEWWQADVEVLTSCARRSG